MQSKLLCAAVALVASLATSCSSEPARPANPAPNIVLLVADDLGRDFVGAYGNDTAPTRHIDRLASEGLLFERAFTPTGICRPARWAIYTGLYPHATGVVGFSEVPHDVPLLHSTLAEAGYRTGLIGKFGSRVQGFQPFELMVHVSEQDPKDVEGLAATVERFFDGDDGRPFFLLVGFGDAHAPYPEGPHPPASSVRIPGYLPDVAEVREAIAPYYSAVARLDRGVGLVLDALERRGLEERTLVVFTSDQGPAFPFAKSTLLDAAVAVPLLVRWPGKVAPGTTTGELVSFVDLRSTLLEAAGLAPAGPSHGHSLLPLLRGETIASREAVLLSHSENLEGSYPMRGVRTRDFKYIRNFEPDQPFSARLELQRVWRAVARAALDDPSLAARLETYRQPPAEQLYDLHSDPYELRNLAGDPAHASELERLRAILDSVRKELGDTNLEVVAPACPPEEH